MYQRGFTLIEVMVVIFVMALVIGFLSPRFEFSDDQYLRREALRFRNVLQWATEQALYEEQEIILEVDFAENLYRLSAVVGDQSTVVNDSLVKERRLKASAGKLQWGFDRGIGAKDKLAVRIGPWGPVEPIFLQFNSDDNSGGYQVLYTLMQFRPVIKPWSD